MLHGVAKPDRLACGRVEMRLGMGHRTVCSGHLPAVPQTAVLAHTPTLGLGRRAKSPMLSHATHALELRVATDGCRSREACVPLELNLCVINPVGAAPKRTIRLLQCIPWRSCRTSLPRTQGTAIEGVGDGCGLRKPSDFRTSPAKETHTTTVRTKCVHYAMHLMLTRQENQVSRWPRSPYPLDHHRSMCLARRRTQVQLLSRQYYPFDTPAVARAKRSYLCRVHGHDVGDVAQEGKPDGACGKRGWAATVADVSDMRVPGRSAHTWLPL